MKAVSKFSSPDDIEISIELTMTIGELREVMNTLNAGKTGYYGPAVQLIGILREISLKSDRVFIADGECLDENYTAKVGKLGSELP